MPIIYSILPSLKHIAEISVAISVWNQHEVRAFVSEFNFSKPCGKGHTEWQKIENKAIEQVQYLQIPAPLRQEVSAIIRPIGLRLLSWMSFNWQCLSAIKLQKEFYWTPHGTINAKKTAEVLVTNDSLSVRERYELACIYCLEDHIYILWEQLNEPYKEDLKSIRIHEPPLVSFWSYYIKGELAELSSTMNAYCAMDDVHPYEYAFHLSAIGGNEVATRYFVEKLNDENKDRILVKTARHVAKKRHCPYDDNCDGVFLLKSYHTDVLCFLLSILNDEQQLEFFKVYPFVILKCLLEWPWQGFFAITAKHIWSFLREEYSHTFNDVSSMVCEYNGLLKDIIGKVYFNYKDYSYEDLFEVFWKQIPADHKRCVINECVYDPYLLSVLFTLGHTDNIKRILSDATPAEREKIIFHVGKFNCKQLVLNGKWHLLKFFIEQCVSSKEMMIKFKEELEKYIKICVTGVNDEWSKISRLLDSLIQAYDKRKSVEEDCTSKKFCGIEHVLK